MNSQQFFDKVYENDNEIDDSKDPIFESLNNHTKQSHKVPGNSRKTSISALPPSSPSTSALRRVSSLPSTEKAHQPPALKSSVSAPVADTEMVAKGRGRKKKVEPFKPIKKQIFKGLSFCMFVKLSKSI